MTITVTSLLWKDARRAGESLECQLREASVSRDVLATNPVDARVFPVLDERISEAVRGAIDLNLGDVVIGAWTGYRTLREAAATTRAGGPPVDVMLAEHEITMVHHPVVDILVDGVLTGQLTFDLVLSLLVRSAIAVVDNGRLIALRGGEVAAKAALELRGTTLAEGERTCLAGMVVTLGSGVDLVGTPPNPTPTTSPAPMSSAPSRAHQTSTSSPSPDPIPISADGPWWGRTASAATAQRKWWQPEARQP
jgi:hypothetical protein